MDITIGGVSAAVITGIVAEVIKRLGVDTKFIPLISILAAVAVVCVGTWTISVEAVITGIIIGSATSGIYDNIIKGKDIATSLAK